jgi:transformation/transcription domain-associated protein
MQEEPSFCTYYEAYEINCARYGREADLPIMWYKRQCSLANGQFRPDADGHIRIVAFAAICEKLVSENVFSQYIYKTLPTGNHLWAFKKVLCMQLALSGELLTEE